jgi:hypothetical protein
MMKTEGCDASAASPDSSHEARQQGVGRVMKWAIPNRTLLRKVRPVDAERRETPLFPDPGDGGNDEQVVPAAGSQ